MDSPKDSYASPFIYAPGAINRAASTPCFVDEGFKTLTASACT